MSSGEGKENLENQNKLKNYKKRKSNTTKEQYAMMQNFVLNNNETNYGRQTFSEMWENLAIQLNKIGPPVHTSVTWRKKWTDHKYDSMKRKPKRRKLTQVENDQSESSESSEEELFDSYFERTTIEGSGMNESVSASNETAQPSTSDFEKLPEPIDGNVDISQFESVTQLDSFSGNASNETEKSSTLNFMQLSECNNFQLELLKKLDVIITQQEKLNNLVETLLKNQQ